MAGREQRALHRAAAKANLAQVQRLGWQQLRLFTQSSCLVGQPSPTAPVHVHALHVLQALHSQRLLTCHALPAVYPSPCQVRRLLERNPSLAAAPDALLYTALHKVAMHTCMPTSREAIAAMLLAAAPQTAAATDHKVCAQGGQRFMHRKAASSLCPPGCGPAALYTPGLSQPATPPMHPLKRRAAPRCTTPPPSAPWAWSAD